MKNWIFLLVSSIFLLSCSKGTAKLPDDLGEFKLGMSMHSVVTMLNSKGLSEVNLDNDVWVGNDQFPKYSYDIQDGTFNTIIGIRFSTSSPYFYDKEKWEWVILEFYQGELYDIELLAYYTGRSGIEECFKTYKDEEQKLHSRYKKHEKESNQGGDYANVTYENDNKNLYLIFIEDEGLTSFLTLVLRDFKIEDKVYSAL